MSLNQLLFETFKNATLPQATSNLTVFDVNLPDEIHRSITTNLYGNVKAILDQYNLRRQLNNSGPSEDTTNPFPQLLSAIVNYESTNKDELHLLIVDCQKEKNAMAWTTMTLHVMRDPDIKDIYAQLITPEAVDLFW